MGIPPELAAALGYASVFGSASNTFLAPVLIGAEVFGFAYFPHFFIVCAFAYLFNLNKFIYSLQKIWGCLLYTSYYGDENAVNVHISRLRNKIEDNPREPGYILTVWGIGYKLGENR